MVRVIALQTDRHTMYLQNHRVILFRSVFQPSSIYAFNILYNVVFRRKMGLQTLKIKKIKKWEIILIVLNLLV